MDNHRIPPSNIEAEQSVLGGVFLERDAIDQVSHLVESDFYHQHHRLIWRSLIAMHADNQPLDVITVSTWLKDRNLEEESGGLAYLGTLAKDTPSAANIRAYADIVKDKALRRQLITNAMEMATAAYENSETPSKELINQFEQQVFALGEQAIKGRESVRHIRPILKQTLDEMQQMSQKGPDDQLLGVSTGSVDLNDMIGGLEPGNVYIIAGRPSMGKTTAAMNMAEDIALHQGKPALVFSMEMPDVQLTQRIIASQGRVSLAHVRKTWEMTEDDWPKVASAAKVIADKPLYIDDTPGLTPLDIRSRARKLRREIEAEHLAGLGLIVIDYLQLMESTGDSRENRATQVSSISRQLKLLAKELNVPVVVLSQLNRSLENRPNKRPIMADLRESGAIEQDADVIIFIYRDEVYNEDSDRKGVAEFIIGKQRNGALGTVIRTANLQYSRFDDYQPDVYGGYE